MRSALLGILSLVLAGCAAAPVAPPAGHLFRDTLFSPASERISAADVFAVNHEMRRYLTVEIGDLLGAVAAKLEVITAKGP